MAVSEKKVTGKFYRIWSTADKLWHRISFWTHANDVEFNDGKTAQTKVGAIKGITTSTNTAETGYAADATTITTLNQSIATLNSSLDDLKTDFNKFFNKLNGIRITAGTVVRTAKTGENSFVLFSLEQIKNMFESSQNITASKIAILVSNGDGSSFPYHLESVTFLHNNWYVVFKDTLKTDMDCRVQYVIVYLE